MRWTRCRACAIVWSLMCLWTVSALDPYATLGVSKGATDSQVKKAYRKLSKQWHPDKNPGDDVAATRFVEVSQAYEILSDPEKRQVYDRHGEEGLKRMQSGQPAGGFHDARDLFSRFFGGGQQQESARRGHNMVTEIEVDLKAIYTGTTLPLTVQRKAICDSCDGSGARKSSDIVSCQTCGGAGVRLIRQQLAPGMFTQMQMACDQCGGRGKRIAHVCPKCGGHRVIDSSNQLDLDIDRGLPEGSEMAFEGEADESPDWIAGDVIVRIRSQARSGGFARKGENLYWRQILSLSEALLGFEHIIGHLDGHKLTLRRTGVTQPGFVQVIENEGMPHYHLSGYGNLYVTYDVVLPTTLSAGMQSKLKALLGSTARQKQEL